VGRAEGLVWLSFIGFGDGMWLGRDPARRWLLEPYVSAAWPDGRVADIYSSTGGGGAGDDESFFNAAIRDAGHATLMLTYSQNGLSIEDESVALPD
jgi:hypothetical protein